MTRLSYVDRLDPQMELAVQQQKQLAPDIGEMSKLTLEEVRRLYELERAHWNEGGPSVREIENTELNGPHGRTPLRWYHPNEAEPGAVLVFIHGGGWIVGSCNSHDRIVRMLASRSGLTAVSVDYRLSPEHKFPVAFEECLHVVETLMRDDAAPIVLAGDSAGAHMCLAVALELHKREPGQIAGAALFYGGYGLTDSGSRRLYGNAEDGMGRDDLAYYKSCYLGDEKDALDARYDLLEQDMRAAPPCFIVAAELDPVKDDSTTLAAQLGEAGINHELHIYEGVLHGFVHLSRVLDKAGDAVNRGADFLKHCVKSIPRLPGPG